MIISFFKNEAHFAPRRSCVWENADEVKPKVAFKRLRAVWEWVFIAALLVYWWLVRDRLNGWGILAIAVFLLPLHEFCHAAYCWIRGKRVERICFFPYTFTLKNLLSCPAAYVVPEFSAWCKTDWIMLSLFPFFVLSVLPVLVSPFLPSARYWLWFLALANAGTAAFDIQKAVQIASLPRGSVTLGWFALKPRNEQPVTVHKMEFLMKDRQIHHQQFLCRNARLTEVVPPVETDAVVRLRAEFNEQFGIHEEATR